MPFSATTDLAINSEKSNIFLDGVTSEVQHKLQRGTLPIRSLG